MRQKKERPSIPGQGRRPSKKSCNKHLFISSRIHRVTKSDKTKVLVAKLHIFTATMLQRIKKACNTFKPKDIFCSISLLQECCKTATHAGGGHCYVC